MVAEDSVLVWRRKEKDLSEQAFLTHWRVRFQVLRDYSLSPRAHFELFYILCHE